MHLGTTEALAALVVLSPVYVLLSLYWVQFPGVPIVHGVGSISLVVLHLRIYSMSAYNCQVRGELGLWGYLCFPRILDLSLGVKRLYHKFVLGHLSYHHIFHRIVILLGDMLDLWKVHFLLLTHNFEGMGRLFLRYLLLSLELIMHMNIPIPGAGHGLHPGHAASRERLRAHIMVDLLMLAAIALMPIGGLIDSREPGIHKKGTLALLKLMISHGNLWLWEFLMLIMFCAREDDGFICKLVSLQA